MNFIYCHSSCQFSFWGRTYIDWLSSCQFVFNLSWDRTYIDQSFILSIQLVFWGRTYIDRSSSCQFVFSLSWDRTYIDRSFILLVQLVFWGRTHINRSSSYLFVLGLHPYRSIIHRVSSVFWVILILIGHSSCLFELELGPHLYQLVIVLSVWVWVFRVAPISIDHLPVSLFFSSSWDRTYIDRSSSYQFEFMRQHLYRSVIVMLVQFESLRPHLVFCIYFLWFWSLWPHLIHSFSLMILVMVIVSHPFSILGVFDHGDRVWFFLCFWKFWSLWPHPIISFRFRWL